MKVYLVNIGYVEGTSVVCVCKTKQIAERELFKTRDKLIKEWREGDERSRKWIEKYCKEKNVKLQFDDNYLNMIHNLSSDDYENWDNYPQECPYITELDILDQ